MENVNEHIDNLIIHYKNGAISNDEVEELYAWIELNDENKSYFKEQMEIISLFGPKNTTFAAKQGLNRILKESSSSKTYPLSIKWLAAVATVAILITLGFVVFNTYKKMDNETISYNSGNQILSFTLDDHSEVSLSKNSTLIKSKQFETNQRFLKLKGKAFFKVSKDIKRPFIVMAGNIEVKVLGTSFEVINDTINNLVKVAVSEGKVSVKYISSDFPKILGAKDQITFNQKGKLIDNIVLKDENHLAWKTRVLTFNNTPLKDVVKELSLLYDKAFKFGSPEIENYLLTTKIDKQSLEEVKIILEKTLDIKLKDQNDTIFLFLP